MMNDVVKFKESLIIIIPTLNDAVRVDIHHHLQTFVIYEPLLVLSRI